jgi:type IV secretion system protein VirB10
MTGAGATPGRPARAKVAPDTLALSARPQPVTRINRRVLIGVAAIGLMLISGLVLLALKPPSLRLSERAELFNVDHKPLSDGLAKLPASYDGVRPATSADQATPPPAIPKRAPTLAAHPETPDQGWLARLASQAHESPVLFRLETKAAQPNERASLPEPDRSQPLLAPSAARWPENASLLAAAELDLADPGSEPARKLSFLKAEPEARIYNPHGLQRPASPYQLMAGTIIAASLLSGLNSDLPGFVIAQVTEHVWDSVAGRHLLIPQGSRLVGRYDNVVAFGQQRALVIWQRLLLPDGSSIVIDNLPATDSGGYAGLADAIDLHTWTLLKGVALATLLGVGSELAFAASDSDLVKALKQSTQSTGNRAGQRLIERNLTVQPTLRVRPGWPLRVIVHKDLVLKPYPSPSSP